ncbi:hypothetical protein pipiens_011246 [Culex pipiens pipiens]|uniref:Ornithine decarboxylase antizyme n=2 Tax=Culex pipiens TaxID=7175 RepID=A0ABD1D749_CULPP
MSCESPRCRLCLNRHNDPDSALDENLCRQLSSVCQLEITLVPGLPDTFDARKQIVRCVNNRRSYLREPVAVVTVGATSSLPECQQLRPIAEQRCAAVVQSVSLESLDLANDTLVGELLNHPGASLPRQASAPAPDDSLRSELTETEDATHLSRPQGQRDRCGGPDVPTPRTDHDRASPLKEYNRKTSIDSTTTASSEYTDLDFTESTVDYMNQHEAAVIQEVLSQPTPTQVTLKLFVTAQKFSSWETIFSPLDNMLYVNLPSTMSHEASKHSFISLLEFAEEKLECDGVVLCIRKDRLDRPNLVRTFSFVGFQPVSPKSPLTPPHIEAEQKAEYLFMVYNIEE